MEDSKFGVVVDCGSLNIREEPDCNSEVLCTIPVSSKVMIEDDTNGDFYKICTEFGVDGFAMKSYIDVQ